jgi:hypothetical protein
MRQRIRDIVEGINNGRITIYELIQKVMQSGKRKFCCRADTE